MSDKQLDLLKEQLAPLSPQEKLELARFLTEQAKLDQAPEQGEAVIDRAATDGWIGLCWDLLITKASCY
jgi:hypothetical protein